MRLVSVVAPDWLIADQRVGHVRTQLEQLGGGQRFHIDVGVAKQVGELKGQALTRHCGGALTDHQHAVDRAVTERAADVLGQGGGGKPHLVTAVRALQQFAAKGLGER